MNLKYSKRPGAATSWIPKR